MTTTARRMNGVAEIFWVPEDEAEPWFSTEDEIKHLEAEREERIGYVIRNHGADKVDDDVEVARLTGEIESLRAKLESLMDGLRDDYAHMSKEEVHQLILQRKKGENDARLDAL